MAPLYGRDSCLQRTTGASKLAGVIGGGRVGEDFGWDGQGKCRDGKLSGNRKVQM